MKVKRRKRTAAPKITPEMLEEYFKRNRDTPFNEWFHQKVVDLMQKSKEVRESILNELPDWAAEIVKESQSSITEAEAEELLKQGYVQERLEDGTVLYIPPDLIEQEERSGRS